MSHQRNLQFSVKIYILCPIYLFPALAFPTLEPFFPFPAAGLEMRTMLNLFTTSSPPNLSSLDRSPKILLPFRITAVRSPGILDTSKRAVTAAVFHASRVSTRAIVPVWLSATSSTALERVIIPSGARRTSPSLSSTSEAFLVRVE
jgi:hypothetical protein